MPGDEPDLFLMHAHSVGIPLAVRTDGVPRGAYRAKEAWYRLLGPGRLPDGKLIGWLAERVRRRSGADRLP
jgi:hypothetical protein